MSLIITPESPMGIELARWNVPYVYRPLPRMVYKARQLPGGKWSVAEADDRLFGNQPGAAEQFSTGCQRIVRSEEEHDRARADGWRDTPKEALDFQEGLETDIANAAAERNYQDRNMSEKAKAEAEEYDASGDSMAHTPEIPSATKRRGRPPKHS